MAFLINRTAAARIECLHALAKFILNNYGTAKDFSLNDAKFDRDEDNIYNYCTLLKIDDLVGAYCRFKENPLDEAGCSITNGKLSDTTKSKEVGNTLNAMHALGFIQRNKRANRLTDFGKKFAATKYGTKEMQLIIKEAVLNYGPINGILHQLSLNYSVGDLFNINELNIGYPSPVERVRFDNKIVELSSGSRQDSNTRTKSCLIAWLTTAGYIIPANIKAQDSPFAHVAYRDYINRAHRMEQIYQIIELPHLTEVKCPLDYEHLTKQIGSLREHGQEAVRNATIKYEEKINNRRFAILFLLNNSYLTKKPLLFQNILKLFRKYPEEFLVSDIDLDDVIHTELEIAYIAGIPYEIQYDDEGLEYVHPMLSINMDEAQIGAPKKIITILKAYCNE